MVGLNFHLSTSSQSLRGLSNYSQASTATLPNNVFVGGGGGNGCTMVSLELLSKANALVFYSLAELAVQKGKLVRLEKPFASHPMSSSQVEQFFFVSNTKLLIVN